MLIGREISGIYCSHHFYQKIPLHRLRRFCHRFVQRDRAIAQKKRGYIV